MRWPKGRRARQGAVLVGLFLGLGLLYLTRTESPPWNPGDLCSIFTQKRDWYHSARRSFERWGVPESVQLAVIYKESGFRAVVRPPRRRILWILPGPRPSSAYGYAQVLDGTWQQYQKSIGNRGADRNDFADAVDFIGWYGDEIHRRTGIAKHDAYRLYLAYHEGPGGYQRGSFQGKAWLQQAARQVDARARRYQQQYDACEERLRGYAPWRVWLGIFLLVVLVYGTYAWRRHRPTARRRRGR